MAQCLKIRQIKGGNKANPKQAANLRALGLSGIHTEVVRKDTRGIRGMLNVVHHLIAAEQIESSGAKQVQKKSSRKGYSLK